MFALLKLGRQSKQIQYIKKVLDLALDLVHWVMAFSFRILDSHMGSLKNQSMKSHS